MRGHAHQVPEQAPVVIVYQQALEDMRPDAVQHMQVLGISTWAGETRPGDLPGECPRIPAPRYFLQGHGLQAADVELKIHHPFQRFIVPFVVPCIANEGCTGVADEITDEQVERVGINALSAPGRVSLFR